MNENVFLLPSRRLPFADSVCRFFFPFRSSSSFALFLSSSKTSCCYLCETEEERESEKRNEKYFLCDVGAPAK